MEIWKYRLPLSDHSIVLKMPQSAQLLTVQDQNGTICLWAKVDATQPPRSRCFQIYGTGHDIATSLSLRYVGTVQQLQGALVWHVFEVL